MFKNNLNLIYNMNPTVKTCEKISFIWSNTTQQIVELCSLLLIHMIIFTFKTAFSKRWAKILFYPILHKKLFLY